MSSTEQLGTHPGADPTNTTGKPTAQAPSARQVLARIRRTVDRLATSGDHHLMQTPGPHAAAAVARAVDAVIDAERLDPYMRSGRTQVLSGALQYAWTYYPRTGYSVAHLVRGVAQRLRNGTHDTDTWGGVAGLAQDTFSPRDPRLAWLLDESLVLDEVATNHHPTGLLDARMRRRLVGDVAAAKLLAAELGVTFAGIRVLPLNRPAREAVWVAAPTGWDDLSADSLTVTALRDSVVRIGGTWMPAGAW